MYTIGQVSKMFNISISTLRYYDKEGLFPGIKRISGQRKFSDDELESIRVIETLKNAGMQLKDIRQYMQWCAEGDSTYSKRLNLFETQRQNLEIQIHLLEKSMAMIKFKCWYYDQVIKEGSSENIIKMVSNHLPDEIQRLYDFAHDID
ncbi:MerR family transcriptional regulator [Pseudoramibacter alactolyticus]